MIWIRLAALDDLGQADDSLRHWLAADPVKTQADHAGPGNYAMQSSRQIQAIAGAGWSHARYEDGAKETNEMRFGTSRLFPTGEEAQQWCDRWTRQDPDQWPHPLQGDIIKRYGTSAGWTEERFVGASLQKPAISIIGETVQLQYNLRFRWSEPGESGSSTYLIAEDSLGADVWLVDDNGVRLVADTLS